MYKHLLCYSVFLTIIMFYNEEVVENKEYLSTSVALFVFGMCVLTGQGLTAKASRHNTPAPAARAGLGRGLMVTGPKQMVIFPQHRAVRPSRSEYPASGKQKESFSKPDRRRPLCLRCHCTNRRMEEALQEDATRRNSTLQQTKWQLRRGNVKSLLCQQNHDYEQRAK